MFKDGPVEGVTISPLSKYADTRGWLVELFRKDELEGGESPPMSYISLTLPGVSRGPHEHEYQSDYFCFIGASDFRIFAWDNREDSPTFRNRMVFELKAGSPSSVIIPPKVVHAYKNIGSGEGLVINFPDRLFRGVGKREPVDETRYEDEADSEFIIE
ncbi:MAG: dTDP-4-dehydrorhamnose 3,5-epimerase family protein [Nitrospinota bacterium]